MTATITAPCVLFVHGAGDGAYKEDAKLVSSLAQNLRADFEIRYPRMPNEASRVMPYGSGAL